MANNYVEFSEELTGLSAEELTWLKGQLEIICVIDGQEYPADHLPVGCRNKEPEWRGCRGLRDYPEYDPTFIEAPEFQFEFEKGAEDSEESSLWIYGEEGGNIDQICHIVQKFLKQFRPNDYWSLTFAATCSKPRVGEFSGGAVFVTAETIRWDNAESFIEREKAAFVERRIGNLLCWVGVEYLRGDQFVCDDTDKLLFCLRCNERCLDQVRELPRRDSGTE